MFQVFRLKYCIFYVEGEKKMIAEMLIRKYFTTETIEYIGEYNKLSEVYKDASDIFIDGVDSLFYEKFIKDNGLVNLMRVYWDEFYDEFEKVNGKISKYIN